MQGNKYKLNKDNYLYCFASFLLGRNIYGPGKYIFGVFDTREMDETYKVIYNDGEDENDFWKLPKILGICKIVLN